MYRIARASVRIAAVAVLLLWSPATGTVVQRSDLADLAHSAEMVLHGRVMRHWSG